MANDLYWYSGFLYDDLLGSVSAYASSLGIELFVVKRYDGYDRDWMDKTVPLPRELAEQEWLKATKQGTIYLPGEHKDYFEIFPWRDEE